MKTVFILKEAGSFAENKDIAQKIRIDTILPALRSSQQITLDFTAVEGATQSFVHALISEPMREFGSGVLDRIVFKSCNDTIQQIVLIVTDYMQES